MIQKSNLYKEPCKCSMNNNNKLYYTYGTHKITIISDNIIPLEKY
jgi:hypothetical protein